MMDQLRRRLLPSFSLTLGPCLTIPLGFGWLAVGLAVNSLYHERHGSIPTVLLGPVRITLVRPRRRA